MQKIVIAIALCIVLLIGCDSTQDISSTDPNSSPTVERLTPIGKDGGSISIASKEIAIAKGQKILVPVYSHIYHGDKQESFLLSVTLSIRNTSLTDPIAIRSVRYYNSAGKVIKSYDEGYLQVAPLATITFFIPQEDTSGGSGANFIVEWVAEKKNVAEPIIEAIMLNTTFQQGVSFTTFGRAIQELK